VELEVVRAVDGTDIESRLQVKSNGWPGLAGSLITFVHSTLLTNDSSSCLSVSACLECKRWTALASTKVRHLARTRQMSRRTANTLSNLSGDCTLAAPRGDGIILRAKARDLGTTAHGKGALNRDRSRKVHCRQGVQSFAVLHSLLSTFTVP
jgi:hypothetical protein